jgi:hypothetical protein
MAKKTPLIISFKAKPITKSSKELMRLLAVFLAL